MAHEQGDGLHTGALHKAMAEGSLVLHNLKQAEADLRAAIAAKPLDPDNYYNLGTMLHRQGDRPEQAEQLLRKAAELAPERCVVPRLETGAFLAASSRP